MATQEEKIESLQRDNIRLEMEIKHVKEQQAETKQDMKDFKEDIDKRFEDLTTKIQENHTETKDELKEINNLITEGMGAKKMLGWIFTGLAGLGSIAAFLYKFFKP